MNNFNKEAVLDTPLFVRSPFLEVESLVRSRTNNATDNIVKELTKDEATMDNPPPEMPHIFESIKMAANLPDDK